MAYQFSSFTDIGERGLSAPLLAALLDDHARTVLPRCELFWSYYRNPMDSSRAPTLAAGSRHGASRAFRLAQERGLPARLTGISGGAAFRTLSSDDRAADRREVVIENDIAWRIHAMVDFLFSRPLKLVSTAADPALRERIEAALDATWEASGGMGLLQDAGLLGHVYGHVDLLVRAGTDLRPFPFARPHDAAQQPLEPLLEAARLIRIEIVDPSRGIAITSQHDYRLLDGYIIHFTRASDRIDPATGRPALTTITEIISGSRTAVYHDEGRGPRLIDESDNTIDPGRVPVVHIQNVSQPFAYSGLSEVEPLIPLQDELNTRLSDRACRVTMQSFKMYLAKGIDGFDKFPVGPGTIWSTDNPDASVTEFGGDGSSPSEDAHIAQIREALDKTSGVPPLATGVVQAKVGNLSSENALRLTLSGLLSRTQRKRLLYGRGIEQVSRLVLAALDNAGILTTAEADRGVKVQWGDPLPSGELESLAAAKGKRELGVEPDQVLGELGYGRADVGVT